MSGRDHAPAVLYLESTRNQLHKRLGGPPDRVEIIDNLPNTVIRFSDLPARSKPLHR
jgi:hypothetical protein